MVDILSQQCHNGESWWIMLDYTELQWIMVNLKQLTGMYPLIIPLTIKSYQHNCQGPFLDVNGIKMSDDI